MAGVKQRNVRRSMAWGAIAALALVFAAWAWLYYWRSTELIQRQLFALGHATAAYIQASGGQLPGSGEALRAAGFLKEVSPGRFVVNAPQVPSYFWNGAYPSSTQISLKEFEVGEVQEQPPSSILLIRPKSQRHAIVEGAKSMDEHLRTLADRYRQQAGNHEGEVLEKR